MSHIFISYSHKDKGYAHRLEDALKRRGFEVWLDDRIDCGTQWPKRIQERLDGCEALILIMTPRSYDSEWVQSELSRAKRKRKNIFPLLLEGDEPWLPVETTQYVDVTGGNLPPTAFYDTLARVVPRKGVGASEQTEVIPTSQAAIVTNLPKESLPRSLSPSKLDAQLRRMASYAGPKQKYKDLKVLAFDIEADVRKAERGNKAAGTRVRQQMHRIIQAAERVRGAIIVVRQGQ